MADEFLWDYVPTLGDVVFDVGAGFGTELFSLQRLVGEDGHVYAFEPHPATFKVLARLCEENGWSNVEPIQVAVADYCGSAWMSDDISYQTNDILRASSIEVLTETLDDFIESRKIERVDFLKMNIEGAEVKALHGMERCAPRVRHLCICCHDFLGPDRQTKAEVRDWLSAHNFGVRERADSRWRSILDYLYATDLVTAEEPADVSMLR